MFLRLVSTKNPKNKTLIKNAILNPITEDKGLWSFPLIPKVNKEYFDLLPKLSFKEIAYDISCKYYLNEEIGDDKLKKIINNSFYFPIKNNKLQDNLSICELYHGNSKSFKDIGISFTANLIEEINKSSNKKLKIVTATTGDTGAAVASAFYNKQNIDIHILYPKNKISTFQRKQMTTFGNNVKCYEVEGNFDDCQKIVKKLLNDSDLENITSCNSVNIGRILSQIFYYFEMCKYHLDKEINIAIPTGNLGNGLSCYISKEMGLPINDIILACNNNSNLINLLKYNDDIINTSVKTYANAMDIIYPSNYERLKCFKNKYDMKSNLDYDNIFATKTNDTEIINMINYLYDKKGVIIDPHTAVAFDGLFKYPNKTKINDFYNIVVSTADPIKFCDEIPLYYDLIDDLSPIRELVNKNEFITNCNDYNDIKRNIK